MNSINSIFIRKSKYQINVNEKITQCLICERKCKIPEGKSGFCQTRLNKEGIIYTIVYGCVPALSYNPIEKKPLFHFYPGSIAITIGTYGCNFSCFWCQNHHISHPNVSILDSIKTEPKFISPEELIKLAVKNNCQGTSISFNEPTLLFEYSLDTFKLAKKAGLYNTYVSNGYMTEEVLRDLIDAGLDAINIDIKGNSEMVKNYCGADIEKVWRNAKLAKDLGVHVEITTLLIQNLNTDLIIIESIAKRILSELGKTTPFHLTRFFPQYKSNEFGYEEATPEDLLYNSYNAAKNVGLEFVYLGNLNNTDFENTTCPNCSKIVIKRVVYGVKELNLDSNGNCKFCGYPICKYVK